MRVYDSIVFKLLKLQIFFVKSCGFFPFFLQILRIIFIIQIENEMLKE